MCPVPRLLLATNNAGKIAELRRLLGGCGWELATPAELEIQLSTVETGATYEENAKIKAIAGARASGLVTLADDSGLEIECLAGAPGVASARFLGEDASYGERFQEIERRLQGRPQEERRARFVCVIALASPGSAEVRFVRGEVEGFIAEEPRGEGGFGYDPIFWVPQHSATMAIHEQGETG
jgi:XTP/dITP diphosphohydrolase